MNYFIIVKTKQKMNVKSFYHLMFSNECFAMFEVFLVVCVYIHAMAFSHILNVCIQLFIFEGGKRRNETQKHYKKTWKILL